MKFLRIILVLFIFANHTIAQKSNNSANANKKIEIDLTNLWDEYSGTLEAYSLGYFFGKEAIAPESYNNFKIFKSENKIIWTQSSQKYGTDIYDGIYSLIVESPGTIVKLKCKFNLRNAGRNPSTPERTLIIDLSKSSGICVEESKGLRTGQTFNIFTQKALSKIREDEMINRIKESEEAQRKYEKEKKEKELIANAQKLKEYNAKEGIISNLNVGESHWRTTCIFRSEDKKYSIVSNNWELQNAPYETIYSEYEKLGKGWMLPNLREAKILQKNNIKFNLKYSFDNLLIVDNGIFYVLDDKNHRNQIRQIDLDNGNYDYLFLKYYGDTSQLLKSRQKIINDYNNISNLSVGDVKDNYFIIENSNIKNAIVMLTNCPVITVDKIEEELKELGDEWRIPDYKEAFFINNLVKSNKKIKKLIPYGGFGIFEFSNYYSYNFNPSFRNYNDINELEKYGRRINNPTGVYSTGNEVGLIRFCPIKTFF